MGEEASGPISVGLTPTIGTKHLHLSRAFNLDTGQWIVRMVIKDDRGQSLAVALNHEAYHLLTSFLVEHDDDLYNHKDQH